MSLRADPVRLSEELKDRNKGIRSREEFDSFFDLVKKLVSFLELSQTDLFEARNKAISEDDQIHTFMDILGMPRTIGYVKYSSDKEALIRVLREPHKCLVWEQFCKLIEPDKVHQGTLFFTLKGGIHMCMTNVPVKQPAGVVMHMIKSADKSVNDVYIMELEQVPIMMYQTSIRG